MDRRSIWLLPQDTAVGPVVLVVSMTGFPLAVLLLSLPCHTGSFGQYVAFVGRPETRRSLKYHHQLLSTSSDDVVESAATLRSVTFSRLPKGEGASVHCSGFI